MSSNQRVSLGGLADALNGIIEEYSDEVIRDLPETTKAVGKTCVKTLKAEAKAAGIGGTKYVGSFRSKETRNDSRATTVTVYSSKYQLAHLLEHGHVVRNRPGGRIVGMARAFPHWAEAEEKASEELEKKIKMKISGES
ncbi:MAG: hypothetical protein IKY16_07935 [Bacteroidales bacterium]|nr:hypothetical protein [Acidaminococcaceae bacterium]MBR5014518.1 hypothetical protein [Bacteroidales bacterium]